MNDKRLGRQTVALAHPPSVLSFSNIGGKFEGQGPLADFFDEISNDSFFGEKTWEKAESAMQKTVLQRALEKAELTPEGLFAYVSTYAEATTGADVSGLTPENITAMVSRKPGVILTHLPSAIQIQVIGRIEPDPILLNGKMQMRTSGIAGLP